MHLKISVTIYREEGDVEPTWNYGEMIDHQQGHYCGDRLCFTRACPTHCRHAQSIVMCDVALAHCVITPLSLLHISVMGSYAGNLDLLLTFKERS